MRVTPVFRIVLRLKANQERERDLSDACPCVEKVRDLPAVSREHIIHDGQPHSQHRHDLPCVRCMQLLGLDVIDLIAYWILDISIYVYIGLINIKLICLVSNFSSK